MAQGNYLYLYCIIETGEERNFGPIGVGGRGDMVTTINYEDISGVVSRTPLLKYDLNRENLLGHQRVVEEVMKEYTVLPVRFCTVAECAEDIRGVLRKRYAEFKKLIREMDNKTELGVKALWKDIKVVFRDIAEGDPEIRRLREKIASKPLKQNYSESIALGRMVQAALESKKNEVADNILKRLKPIALDTAINKAHGDSMILNSAFLVHGGRVKEFDDAIAELESSNNDRLGIKYVGPVAPFNFINIVVEWR
ncbi:MAG: GvpL/GvpF family gas vesicle protein [Deltaproteobacteria bacterium]|nr:GvpL/GvpF family gas vesicle protein [Deltaproteobacteria bacterium]